VTCITAPIFGAVLGGWAGSALGGFRAKYTLISCILAAAFCVALGFIMPSLDYVRPIVADIWFILFFGGYALPNLTGVMLTTVPIEMRS